MVEKTAIALVLYTNCSIDDGLFGVYLDWTGVLFEFGLFSGKRACWSHAVVYNSKYIQIRVSIISARNSRRCFLGSSMPCGECM